MKFILLRKETIEQNGLSRNQEIKFFDLPVLFHT